MMIAGLLITPAVAATDGAPAAGGAPTPLATPPLTEIDEYIVDGNSALSAEEIEAAVYPYLGPGKSADDIAAARAALEKAYHERGFQTVQVAAPAEAGPDGVVHLQVTEVKVGRLRVVGSRYYSLDEIKREAPSVAPGAVPNIGDLQNDTVTLNQWPHRQVTPELKAGKRPDTVDVNLLVKDDPPLRFNLEVNNQRSASTTPLRLTAGADYDNLWQLGHHLSLAAILAPQNTKDSEVLIGSYKGQISGSNVGWGVNFIHSNSDVATVGSTDVLGKGLTVGGEIDLDLPSDEDFVQTGKVTADYKDYSNKTDVGGSNPSQSLVPVTYVVGGINYVGTVHEATATDTANLTLTFAPPRVGSNRAELDLNRYDLRGLEFYLRAQFDRTQNIYWGFQAHARLAGQITDGPLVQQEQFSIGGVSTVRGYHEGEKLADSGYAGTFELLTPDLVTVLGDWAKDNPLISNLRFLTFIDGGFGIIHDPLAGQQTEFQLSSIGVGLTSRLADRINGGISLASPLIATDNTKAHRDKVLFTVSTEY